MEVNMKLAKLPYGMIDVDKDTRALLESLEERWFFDGVFFHKTASIEAFGIKDDILHVIGIAGDYDQMYFEIKKNISTGSVEEIVFEPNKGPGIISALTFSMYDRLPDTKKRRKQTEDFWNLRDELVNLNRKDIGAKIKNIRILRGMVEGVECDSEIFHAKINTGEPETRFNADMEYLLRVEAHRVGADAVAFINK